MATKQTTGLTLPIGFFSAAYDFTPELGAVGSGTAAVNAISASGVGGAAIVGTGSGSVNAIGGSGAGIVGINGSGSGAVNGIAASGAGASIQFGIQATQIGLPTLLVARAQSTSTPATITGSGSGRVNRCRGRGRAQTGVVGTALVAVNAISGSGTGTTAATGIGLAVVEAITATGVGVGGSVGTVGFGGGSVNAISAAGVGLGGSVSGVGSGAVNAIDASGTGTAGLKIGDGDGTSGGSGRILVDRGAPGRKRRAKKKTARKVAPARDVQKPAQAAQAPEALSVQVATDPALVAVVESLIEEIRGQREDRREMMETARAEFERLLAVQVVRRTAASVPDAPQEPQGAPNVAALPSVPLSAPPATDAPLSDEQAERVAALLLMLLAA